MLSLLFMLLFSMLCCWMSLTLSMMIASLISLSILQQYFGSAQNMMFSSSGISGLLVFLSCLLCLFAYLSTPSEKGYKYTMSILYLCIFLILAFSMSNVIMFYVFFEASLVPTLILIIGWGYQPERLQAGSYMMLYTVGASLPLLLVLLWRSEEVSSSVSWLLGSVSGVSSGILGLVIYGAFLVKLPMYTVHLWLPKAHVEAPLAGSMILAGILLKLGGYGIMQMNLCFSIQSSNVMMILVSISMWGGLLSALMCLRQVDVKALVAYSSVGHMGIVSAGLLLDTSWGVSSAVITMVAHGLSSSALFCLAYFTYEKSHTRNIPYVKGFLQLYPSLTFFWFLFCCINMAAPPTMNLVGELLIVPSLWSGHIMLVIVMGLMVFFSAAYNMYLYSSINHGSSSSHVTAGGPLRSFESMSLLAHMGVLTMEEEVHMLRLVDLYEDLSL
uniref:NADH-ubiquinone oxidoreductase chain 4 n=1 Tax=Siphonaria pectinata TaxID=57642 RepID=B3DFE4_9GAST|nr:NADH dehydrogenase subunit 4 [Siphonaria pectinata]ACE62831.1 NADH dehydrogenase subunit 4 [Siphonaria pectinata]